MRALLIDLDHTLYPYPPAHEAGLRAASPLLAEGAGLEDDAFRAAYERARAAQFVHLGAVAAAHSRELYFKAVVEEALGRPAPALTLAALDAYWEGYLEAMELFPRMLELLDRVADAGVRLGLLTNLTVGVQLRKLVRLGVAERFDAIVTSEEAGADKPHPRGFRQALELLDVAASEACMVGDDFEKDVLGAAAMGMPAIWLRLGQEDRELPPGTAAVDAPADLLEAPWDACFPGAFPDEGSAA